MSTAATPRTAPTPAARIDAWDETAVDPDGRQTPVDAARRAREPALGRDDDLGRASRLEESDRMT
jgi:hypothetical protein